MVDRIQTVSRRSKPSSRTILIGEQPNPWNRFQFQEMMSRHRGAKRFRQFGLSRIISLLSPAYLLSVERWLFHIKSSDHYDKLYSFYLTCKSYSQANFYHYALQFLITSNLSLPYVLPRYFLVGDRPSQTTNLILFLNFKYIN